RGGSARRPTWTCPRRRRRPGRPGPGRGAGRPRRGSAELQGVGVGACLLLAARPGRDRAAYLLAVDEQVGALGPEAQPVADAQRVVQRVRVDPGDVAAGVAAV